MLALMASIMANSQDKQYSKSSGHWPAGEVGKDSSQELRGHASDSVQTFEATVTLEYAQYNLQ